MATNGIAEHPKLKGIVTLLQGTNDPKLKKIEQELWVECTQEIYVEAVA